MRKLIEKLDRHTGAIQALGAILTVMIGIGALIGVKLQIDASDRLGKQQSARDIYREYLNLSINKPEFASPDYCTMEGTPQEAGYHHYVEYYLYTAEQVLAVDSEWRPIFLDGLETHKDYLCAVKEMGGYSEVVQGVLQEFQAKSCANAKTCLTEKANERP